LTKLKEIEQAISVHKMWKDKLEQAIETGKCDCTPDSVKVDNGCSFGKWLYERVDPIDKESVKYKLMLDIHAQFHQQAGKILALTLARKKEEAEKLMQIDGKLYILSKQLIEHLHIWKESDNV
jgi:hypothetical protein